MQDAGYVKEMERMANEGRIIEKDGKTFSSLDMNPVIYEPRPSAIDLRTLTGIRDYLKKNLDGLIMDDLLIQVKNQGHVVLMSKIGGQDRRRDFYVESKYDGKVFAFGQWMDSESFIIALNALFEPTEALSELLNFVSKMKVTEESNIDDNGVGQDVSVRVGIKGNLTEKESAPTRRSLVPFRTFTEIEQPESEFIFRVRRSDAGVSMALFEADGGAWKSEAMERIAGWLSDNTTVVVIA